MDEPKPPQGISRPLNQMASVHAMHEDCVVCLAIEMRTTVEQQTRTLLLMFMSGTEVEDVVRDLCFLHRRQMGDAFERVLEESPDAG